MVGLSKKRVFPKQKGIPSLVKIEHKNTATLDSARSKKKSKVAVLQLNGAVTRRLYCTVESARTLANHTESTSAVHRGSTFHGL